jgi:hypothetical protein
VGVVHGFWEHQKLVVFDEIERLDIDQVDNGVSRCHGTAESWQWMRLDGWVHGSGVVSHCEGVDARFDEDYTDFFPEDG